MSEPDEALDREGDARLAATLVALGFPGERRRFADAKPAALERWRTDPAFRRLADAVAQGLGLKLIDVTSGGDVVLAAEDDTPFAPLAATLLPGNVGSDERRRQLAVLALLAVVAEVFPTEDALAGADEAREVLPAEVVQLLLSRAEAVSREPALLDASGRPAELRRAFEVVREVQPSVPTQRGREGALGLEGIVTHVLRTLDEYGLVREVRTGERVAFRPTAAFAAHARHLCDREALDDALDGLRDARAARASSAQRGA